MALKLYGLNKCTTCQKALDHLAERGLPHSFQDLRDVPVSASVVAAWSAKLGGWEKLINRAGYTWRGLDVAQTQDLNEAKAVALAVKYPALIRRPLIMHDDGHVTVGFSKKVQEGL